MKSIKCLTIGLVVLGAQYALCESLLRDNEDPDKIGLEQYNAYPIVKVCENVRKINAQHQIVSPVNGGALVGEACRSRSASYVNNTNELLEACKDPKIANAQKVAKAAVQWLDQYYFSKSAFADDPRLRDCDKVFTKAVAQSSERITNALRAPTPKQPSQGEIQAVR